MEDESSQLRPFKATAALILLILGLCLVAGACAPKACKDRAAEQEQAVRDATRRVNDIVRPEETVWPADMPEGVPEFTQGRIVSTQEGLTPNGTSWTIAVADVEEGGFDAYLALLRDAGWEAALVPADAGGTISATTESLDLKLSFSGNRGTIIVRMKQF